VLSLFAITAGLMIGGVVIDLLAGSSFELSGVFIWLIAFVFAAVGALIAIRQPANKLGWIFLGVALSAGLAEITSAYADYWTNGKGGVQAIAEAAAWYASLSWMPFILVPATFLLLLFPDGHLLSARWRPIAWCAAIGIIGGFVATGLTAGQLEDYPQLANPYAVDSGLIDLLTGLAWLALLIGVLGSAASLVIRYRRAAGDRRLQMKWLALAGGVAAVTFPVAIAGSDLWGDGVANVAIMISVIAIPIAAGIAILRYRLYDIDVVVNRTVVYGVLTATLAGVYIASVLLLQVVLNGATGDSSLAVAASTLGVAALFRPARTRIQRGVERRFFRRRYDARVTLEAFAGRLRDEVALDALSLELRNVVTETVQPEHVSLWLREGAR
jgi:hypothetical protein